jgi:hypothetical protein
MAMGRVLLRLFRLGILTGIFVWALATLGLARSLQVYVDGVLTGWIR